MQKSLKDCINFSAVIATLHQHVNSSLLKRRSRGCAESAKAFPPAQLEWTFVLPHVLPTGTLSVCDQKAISNDFDPACVLVMASGWPLSIHLATFLG
jgi:hypothetical protein